MLEGNHMQTLKTTNAFLTFFFKKICNITGIVSVFWAIPFRTRVKWHRVCYMSLWRVFNITIGGSKWCWSTCSLWCLRGAYSKPNQRLNLFTQMTTPHKRSIWWFFYHFSYSKKSSKVHTRKGMTEIGYQLIWARSSLKEVLMCFHLKLFTSNLM